MSKEDRICKYCGAKKVEYTHSLTKGLCNSLSKLHKAGNKANINQIGLTSNERNNFQKLRYWGLVSMTVHAGEWRVTRKGIDFLAGDLAIPSQVRTYRGDVVGFGTEFIYILEKSSLLTAETKEDFAANAEPRRVKK